MAYPIPPDQLQEIRELFDRGVLSADIAEQFRIPLGSIIAQRAVYTMAKEPRPDGGADSSVEDAITTTLALRGTYRARFAERLTSLRTAWRLLMAARNAPSSRAEST